MRSLFKMLSIINNRALHNFAFLFFERCHWAAASHLALTQYSGAIIKAFKQQDKSLFHTEGAHKISTHGPAHSPIDVK